MMSILGKLCLPNEQKMNGSRKYTMFPTGDILRHILSFTEDYLFIAPVCRAFRAACPSTVSRYAFITTAAMMDYAYMYCVPDALMQHITKDCHLEALVRAIQLKMTTKYVCRYAAKDGNLRMLQWARKNGYPWDWTCAYAARNNHLHVL